MSGRSSASGQDAPARPARSLLRRLGVDGILRQHADLTICLWPTREVTRVIGAVAQGDLLQTVRLDFDGRR